MAQEAAPLNHQEIEMVSRLFSDPTAFPARFKNWIQKYIEASPPLIPFSQIFGASAVVPTPTGIIAEWGTGTAPSGWLLCDGTAVSRATYAALFTVIGTSFGVGDGSTTFNVPDARGRVSVGKGTHADVNALNNNDGLAVGSRTPKHTHTTTITHTAAMAPGADQVPDYGTFTSSSNSAAFIVLNKIIKT